MIRERLSHRVTVSSWRDRNTVLLVCIASYFAIRFSQIVVGSIVPNIIATFGASRGSIGAALTGMWVVYALVQLPSGVFAERIGERRVVLVALLVTAIATFGLAVAPTFLLFCLGTLGLGIGAGIYYNPATTLIARKSDGVGRSIGIHRIGGQAAGVVAPVVAAVVGVRYGWRAVIGAGTLLAVAVLAISLRSLAPDGRIRSESSMRDLIAPSALRALLASSHTRYTTFLATLVEFVGLAAMAFLPAFLIEHHGLSSRSANLLFTVFFAVAALFQPLGGWLSDRIGRDLGLGLLALSGVIGFGVLALGRGMLSAVPAVVFAGASMSATPVVQSRMIDGLSDDDQGTGFGLFRTIYLLGSALGSVVVGVTADLFGWTTAFGLLSGLFAVVVVSLIATGAIARTT